jgi:hypothetical protein
MQVYLEMIWQEPVSSLLMISSLRFAARPGAAGWWRQQLVKADWPGISLQNKN